MKNIETPPYSHKKDKQESAVTKITIPSKHNISTKFQKSQRRQRAKQIFLFLTQTQ